MSPNSVSTTDKYVTSASSVAGHIYNTLNTSPKSSLSDHISRVTNRNHFIPTMAPVNEILTTAVPSNSPGSYVSFFRHPETSQKISIGTLRSNVQGDNIIYRDSFEKTTLLPIEPVKTNLTTMLKREGLFAMAKYLRQSGLDNVLNETGKLIVIKTLTFSLS